MDALPPNWNAPEAQCLRGHTLRELQGLRIGDAVVTIDGHSGQVGGFMCAVGEWSVLVFVGRERYPYWRRLVSVAKARP